MTSLQQFQLFYFLCFLLAFFLIVEFVKRVLFNHKRLAIIAKSFYNYFYSIEKISHLRTNNWGFVPIDEEIAKYSPDLQSGLQLYKELVKNHNGYIIPENSQIAEIGCGKGAGAEFLVTKFKPREYVGIDYSRVAIKYCEGNYHHLHATQFICGDAHSLPIISGSFDIAVNVESSHIYKNPVRFFEEIYRILKPGGKLLLTDFRVVKHFPISVLEETIRKCGFSIIEKRIISPNVYDSCMMASRKRKEIVNHASPWFLKRFFYHYAVLEGTKKFKKLGNGQIVYFLYQLQKKL
jgi:ubiquinone/menaquinone biosynthesis C-methylase UbiE